MKKPLYKRCLRCNRKLTNLEAQQRGYGEHCWKEHLKEKQEKKGLFNINMFIKNK